MSTSDDVLVGRYRLLQQIGAGGMGVVWRAYDERLGRDVAVKRLHPTVSPDDPDAQVSSHRAMREARITARLHHPHAVPVFDVVEHRGQPCLVMQYFPSSSLAELHRRPAGPAGARRWPGSAAEVASALAAAHDAGIVHRDVKPANVLVAPDGTAKISDFGISHAMGDVSLTTSGLVTGTPAYLAPEVARGEPRDPRLRRVLARVDALHRARGPHAVRHAREPDGPAAPGRLGRGRAPARSRCADGPADLDAGRPTRPTGPPWRRWPDSSAGSVPRRTPTSCAVATLGCGPAPSTALPSTADVRAPPSRRAARATARAPHEVEDPAVGLPRRRAPAGGGRAARRRRATRGAGCCCRCSPWSPPSRPSRSASLPGPDDRAHGGADPVATTRPSPSPSTAQPRRRPRRPRAPSSSAPAPTTSAPHATPRHRRRTPTPTPGVHPTGRHGDPDRARAARCGAGLLRPPPGRPRCRVGPPHAALPEHDGTQPRAPTGPSGARSTRCRSRTSRHPPPARSRPRSPTSTPTAGSSSSAPPTGWCARTASLKIDRSSVLSSRQR